MSPNLQAVLEFLARTDLDGHPGGPSLIWAILTGIAGLLFLFWVPHLLRAFTRGGPRTVTKVTQPREYVLLAADGSELYRGRTIPPEPDPKKLAAAREAFIPTAKEATA